MGDFEACEAERSPCSAANMAADSTTKFIVLDVVGAVFFFLGRKKERKGVFCVKKRREICGKLRYF